MLKNLINRYESRRAIRVTKNFQSKELTVLGRLLLEGAREIEVANVIVFPSIDKGFSIFSIENGATLAPSIPSSGNVDATEYPASASRTESALPQLTVGLFSALKNEAYHLVVRQGDGLNSGIVLASFPNEQSASMGLRTLTRRNASRTNIFKVLGALFLAYLLISIPFAKMKPPKSIDEIATTMESRNPEMARQVENANRARTVGSEIMEAPVSQTPIQPDPNTMLGGNPVAAPEAVMPSIGQSATAPVKPAQPGGNFGFN